MVRVGTKSACAASIPAASTSPSRLYTSSPVTHEGRKPPRRLSATGPGPAGSWQRQFSKLTQRGLSRRSAAPTNGARRLRTTTDAPHGGGACPPARAHPRSTTPSPRQAGRTGRRDVASGGSASSRACSWTSHSTPRGRTTGSAAGAPTCRPSRGTPRSRPSEAPGSPPSPRGRRSGPWSTSTKARAFSIRYARRGPASPHRRSRAARPVPPRVLATKRAGARGHGGPEGPSPRLWHMPRV